MAAPRPLFNLGSFLEKDKLKTDGTNFTNWFRTLRILLVPLKMAYVVEGALGDAPADDASRDEKNVSPGLMITTLSRVACSTPWRLSCRNALRGWVHMRLSPTSRRSSHLKPGLNGTRLLKPSSQQRWTSTAA